MVLLNSRYLVNAWWYKDFAKLSIQNKSRWEVGVGGVGESSGGK